MKFSQGRLTIDQGYNCLNFGGDPDHRLDTAIVFRICHCWERREVVNGHKSAAHTIRQMAALVRCALVEVCTVPVRMSLATSAAMLQ